jgi:GNAT superfamily N-acetyltransferase
MWYKFAQEQNDIQELINFFLNKYPEIVLRINEYENKIKLDKIFIPKEMRGLGIGTEIITALKEYSQRVNKPIVLNPEPEKGKKGALQRFYERNEFVDNAGRRKDYDLTDTFSRTMYYKPKETIASTNSFENNLERLTSEFVDAAQQIYDNWDEDPDVYAGGGICHLIADSFVEIINKNYPNYSATTFTRDDIQHVETIVYNIEPDILYDEDDENNDQVELVIIDLSSYIYERGGGFSWTKIPDVEFSNNDITFYKTTVDRQNIDTDY